MRPNCCSRTWPRDDDDDDDDEMVMVQQYCIGTVLLAQLSRRTSFARRGFWLHLLSQTHFLEQYLEALHHFLSRLKSHLFHLSYATTAYEVMIL